MDSGEVCVRSQVVLVRDEMERRHGGQDHVKTEAETRVMRSRARNARATGSWKRRGTHASQTHLPTL